MARITVEDCEEFVDNRFKLVALAAFRTRQLINGDAPRIDPKEGEKKTVISLREIGAGVLFLDQLQEGLVNKYRTVNYGEDNDEDFDELAEEDTYSPMLGLEAAQTSASSDPTLVHAEAEGITVVDEDGRAVVDTEKE